MAMHLRILKKFKIKVFWTLTIWAIYHIKQLSDSGRLPTVLYVLGEAQIVHSIQLNAMKPNELIGHHQVQSPVLGTRHSKVFKTRSCPS